MTGGHPKGKSVRERVLIGFFALQKNGRVAQRPGGFTNLRPASSPAALSGLGLGTPNKNQPRRLKRTYTPHCRSHPSSDNSDRPGMLSLLFGLKWVLAYPQGHVRRLNRDFDSGT